MIAKNSLPKVLICDDDRNIHAAIKVALGKEYDLKSAYNGQEACVIIQKNRFDLVLMDMEMTHEHEGLETIPKLLKLQDDLEIIFFSGHTSFDSVRKAMQAGAADYVPKDAGPDELRHVFKKAIEHRHLKNQHQKSQSEVKKVYRNQVLIGSSPAIQKLKKIIERARNSPAPVVIFGETGSGKEVVARSLRKQFDDGSLEPFVAVDSSTIQSTVAESVLFGYEKGAFTGADKNTPGLFEEANGGTIYFDELANMPIEIQNKLLRVIQEQEVLRIGSTRAQELAFRVIAATNQDLETLVKQGKFKEDLHQRLNVLNIVIPPLRERIEDIPELLEHFSDALSNGLPKLVFLNETIQVIQKYPFPGNVRELSNLVLYLYTMMDTTEVSPLDLPPKFHLHSAGRITPSDAATGVLSFQRPQNYYQAVEQFELEFLSGQYQHWQGNISKMSTELGMDRSYLHSKLKNLGIHLVKNG
jgi:DNA-binding NtrC family response regulator